MDSGTSTGEKRGRGTGQQPPGSTSSRHSDLGKGKIVYALVAHGKTVLAEYTSTSGNFPTVTRVLLGKIPARDGKMSYVYDNHVFHYIVEDEMTYLCMADEQMKRRIPFLFLESIKAHFISSYGTKQARKALPFAMNADFATVLEKQMTHYNTNPDADKITAVKSKIEDVKNVMVENIEKVLQRGEKIDLLVDKTDRMQQAAFTFERSVCVCLHVDLTLKIYEGYEDEARPVVEELQDVVYHRQRGFGNFLLNARQLLRRIELARLLGR